MVLNDVGALRHNALGEILIRVDISLGASWSWSWEVSEVMFSARLGFLYFLLHKKLLFLCKLVQSLRVQYLG